MIRFNLLLTVAVAVVASVGMSLGTPQARAELRAGAAAVDVTPQSFPVLINGGMTSNSATGVTTPVHARAIVLEDGSERLAIVVVDSCMMSRAFLDEAKQLAAQRTGIRPDRMLVSATHAHSVPASMGCLGTDADQAYVPYLRIKLVEAIEKAAANAEPAKVGWAVRNAAHYTALRRWIRRPDRIAEDPFGNLTVRANMHAGRVWEDVTGESGPEDPDLSLLSIQAKDGRPIAVLANFSMHYFSGEKPVSADYFGRFSEGLKTRIAGAGAAGKPPFVGIMSHGCSGDIWRMDYTKQTPPEFDNIKIGQYTDGLLAIAMSAYEEIRYDDQADLAMAEVRLPMKYRVPDKQRLQWAQAIVDQLGDRLPKTTEEVYAREQVLLDQLQQTEVVVQAVRIGSIAIATTPTETYALTGLKLKLQSPLRQTMVIELANGGDGYIPPPEQHVLGGYNTWAARSAGLEVEAEPRIAEAALELLERVCHAPRRSLDQTRGPAAEEILAAKPAAYWRLDETAGPRAVDVSGSHLDGIYESGVVFFLEGPESAKFCRDGQVNRAAHFAGGRLRARVPGLGDHYSVSMWIWNGLPLDARETAGWFFARGRNHEATPQGDALGIAGQGRDAGKLIFQAGDRPLAVGKTAIARWTWAHVRLVREGDAVRVYLNGQPQPELEVDAPFDLPKDVEDLFFGGRGGRQSSWEGRLDEIAVFR
ncbi:MAG: LamG-like jellyroll fold domain-containing protein [Aureliella sp.]